MSAEQTIQSVVIDAYELIDGVCSLSQAIQSVSIDAFFRNQSTVQSIQSVNSQAFIQINAIGSIGQPTQSVAINTMYYDIGIDANIVQPQQSLSSIGIVSLSSQVSVNQAVQYMTANANSVVITSPSPVVVMTRDRILRSIHNRGSR
mgnify:CR=1 FL=1